MTDWLERLIWEYFKELSLKDRLQLIQKYLTLTIREVDALAKEEKAKSP